MQNLRDEPGSALRSQIQAQGLMADYYVGNTTLRFTPLLMQYGRESAYRYLHFQLESRICWQSG